MAHSIHQFDPVGTFNPNCVDCQTMAKSIAKYISPQIVALQLAEKADREKRLKEIDDTMAKLEEERKNLKWKAERGY